MAMLSFCGIDVSKDRLDVVVLPEGWFFSVSNDTAGWAELVARSRPMGALTSARRDRWVPTTALYSVSFCHRRADGSTGRVPNP